MRVEEGGPLVSRERRTPVSTDSTGGSIPGCGGGNHVSSKGRHLCTQRVSRVRNTIDENRTCALQERSCQPRHRGDIRKRT